MDVQPITPPDGTQNRGTGTATATVKTGTAGGIAQYTNQPLPYVHFKPEGWLPPPTSMMHLSAAPPPQQAAEPYASKPGGNNKNPVMVVNERWPEALHTMTWEDVQYTPVVKGYRCTATAQNHTFHAEATSKKTAKQLLAQNIIRTLQPYLLNQCANIVEEQTLPPEGERKRKAPSDSTPASSDPIAKRKAKIMDNVEAKGPLQTFNELVSLSRTTNKDNFEKPEMIETTLPGSDPSKPHLSRYHYVIKMNGQQFEAISGNKKFAKEGAVLRALKAIFGIDLTHSHSDEAIIMKLIDEHRTSATSVALNNILRSYSSKVGLEYTITDQEVERTRDVTALAVNPGLNLPESGAVKFKEFHVQVKLGDQTFEHASPVSKRDAMEGCMFECLCKYFQLDRRMVKEKLGDSSSKDSAKNRITYSTIKASNSADVVSLKNKSPVQALYEIAVRQNLKVEFIELKESQPNAQQQSDMACCKCRINDKEFGGVGKNRKLAKQDAACQALKCLFQIDVSLETTGDKPQFNLQKKNPQLDLEKSEHICKLVVAARTKYAEILADFNVVPSSTFSAFLLTDKENPDNVTVVSLASGSRCNALRRMDGTNLHDCHGAVLARRGLLLYFYQQLEALAGKTSSDPEYNNSIFEEAKDDDDSMETTDSDQQQQRPFDFSPLDASRDAAAAAAVDFTRDDPGGDVWRDSSAAGTAPRTTYRLKKRYAVHLYETAVPPGDASADPYDSLFKDALRTYQPDGIATVPLHYLMKQAAQRQLETFNADTRSMSLSDKLLKWNVLGVQGSLLSLYLEPIYVQSIVLAQACHRQQLKKAIFGRFDPVVFKKSCPDFKPCMPSVYFASDIPPEMQRWEGAISIATSTLVQGSKVASALDNFGAEDNLKAPTDYSLVWTVSTPVIEFITQDSGLELYGRPSRLSKQSFFDHYCKLRRVLTVPDMPNIENHYNEAKQCCLKFVTAKHKFVSYLKASGLGVWLEKSMRMGNFTLPWLSDETA